MKLWRMPDNYMGKVWPGWYVFLGQHRDSDMLTRSNFRVALRLLGGESDTVQVVREGHWAVGWVEWIGIHQDDEKAIALAEDIERKIEDYPALDEEDWSELEYTEAMEYWDSLSLQSKIDECREAGVSIFAARRYYDLPDRLYERISRPC